MKPTDNPLFTNLLAEEWRDQAHTPKPTALNTMLRYSGAYGCLRRMAYDWFEAVPSEPLQPSGVWQMGIGTLIHEAVQAAILKTYPQALFEVPTKVNEYISGSCDALIPNTPLGNVLYELKTMGEYAFDQQVGFKRGFGKLSLKAPEGPKQGAIVQAGMNALGVENQALGGAFPIDTLVLGSLCLSTVTVNMMKQVNISDFARFGAEFHIPREVWYPMTMEEVNRITDAAETIDLGYLPDRWAKDDNGADKLLDPLGTDWNCSYCPFTQLCADDRGGQVRILDSKLVRRG